MNKNAIKNHKIANKKLNLIRDRSVRFIRKNINKISEQDVCNFILSELKKEGMVTDDLPLHFVVANEDTDDLHWNYSGPIKNPKIIKNNSLIMIDIWARLKGKSSPFADITWMFFSGRNIPKKIQDAFEKVISARTVALAFIKKELKNKRFPEANKIDKIVRDFFAKFGLEKFFTHKTGHSLGYNSCQGKYFKLLKTDNRKIKSNTPFTIEPGLYFKGKFGIRSEIDCYITKDHKLIITSSIQRKIVKI
ncbi:MAG: M24 family metallopeptidase [Atribacterota bacterium]|nr:M24 family metallopeptidase [Atribacterota bacterium]